MTVSYFAALERQIAAHEAAEQLRAAEAALFPNLRSQDAQRWWQERSRAIVEASARAAQMAGARFVVDGVAVGVAGLKKWFRRVVGRGLAA